MSSKVLVEAIKKEAKGKASGVVYSWSRGSRIAVDPQVAMGEFATIYKRDGGITPEAVVEQAAPEVNALHKEFEWDDIEAARQHRDSQARYLIRSLVVCVRREDRTLTNPVRAVVKAIPDPEEDQPEAGEVRMYEPRVYVPVAKVMSDSDAQRIYLLRAFKALREWRQRYKDLVEFAGLFEQIDSLGKNLP